MDRFFDLWTFFPTVVSNSASNEGREPCGLPSTLFPSSLHKVKWIETQVLPLNACLGISFVFCAITLIFIYISPSWDFFFIYNYLYSIIYAYIFICIYRLNIPVSSCHLCNLFKIIDLYLCHLCAGMCRQCHTHIFCPKYYFLLLFCWLCFNLVLYLYRKVK